MRSRSRCRSRRAAGGWPVLLALRTEAPEAQRRTPLFTELPPRRRCRRAAARLRAPARPGTTDGQRRRAAARCCDRRRRSDGRRSLLNLFPDAISPWPASASKSARAATRRGSATWRAMPDSTVALTWDGETLSGGVVSRRRGLRPDAGRRRIGDRRRARPVGDARGAAVARRAGGRRRPIVRSPSCAPPARPATIDLLVLYTPAARISAGGDEPRSVAARQRRGGHQHRLQRSGVNAVHQHRGAARSSPTSKSTSGVFGDLHGDQSWWSRNPGRVAARRPRRRPRDLVTSRPPCSTAAASPGSGPTSTRPFSVTRPRVSPRRPVVVHPRNRPQLRRPPRPRRHRRHEPTCATYARAYREGAIRTVMAYPRSTRRRACSTSRARWCVSRPASAWPPATPCRTTPGA